MGRALSLTLENENFIYTDITQCTDRTEVLSAYLVVCKISREAHFIHSAQIHFTSVYLTCRVSVCLSVRGLVQAQITIKLHNVINVVDNSK